MSDYPPQYPWGPHGQKVDVPSVLSHPTSPDPPATFSSSEPETPSYGPSGGSLSSGGWSTAYTPTLPNWSLGKWMRNLAIAGGAIGCLGGIGLGVQMHLPAASLAPQAFRFGLAGAAVGASIPAWVKGAGFAILAALWLALGAVLWVIASALTGQTNWLTGLR